MSSSSFQTGARALTVVVMSALSALAGCGGGTGETTALPTPVALVSGRIADGYINGATVFWDCNGNMVADADEPSTRSGAGGQYSLAPAPAPKAPLLACPLRAQIPASAVDEDTGAAVGTAYSMSAVDGQPGFISPLTTLQSLGGYSEAELRAKFPASANLPFTADYIAAGATGAQLHNAAKFIALALQSVNGLLSTDDAAVRKAALARALAYVPPAAFLELNATPAALAQFVATTPKLDLAINAVSATLDKAQFALVDSAFSGASDARRAYVQLAVDAANRHPEAVVGNSVYWSLIPAAERSTWGPYIVGGNNGFEDSASVAAVRTQLLAAQQTAAAEISAESQKVVKKMATVLAKNAAEMALTSLDSAVKLLPTSTVLSKSLHITRLNTLRLTKTKVTTTLARIENFSSFASSCGGLAVDLGAVDALGDFAEVSKLADIAISTAKCVAGLTKSERMGVIFEGISGGKAFGEGVAEGDLLALLKALSDMTAALMDSAGMSVGSAIYNETLGMWIASEYALNDLNRTSDTATAVFEANTKRITDNFKNIADTAGSALMSARLATYMRPIYLINIAWPEVATVGQPVSVLIDQRLAQPIAYTVDWGTYPNGKAVTADPSRWASAGGAISLSASYSMPGNYPIVVQLYDNSLGVALAAFQILGRDIAVSCPAGTTVNPEGDCVALPTLSPSLAVSFSAAAISTLNANAVSGSVGFITGKDGRPAAKFSGVGAPGHIRISNRAAIQFTDAASFDVWVRMDSLSGMDGYGRTVTDGAYAMAVLAKSHDRSGVAMMANSMTRVDSGLWLASFDARFGGSTCVQVPHPVVALGTWVRLTYVLSSTTGVQAYLNGQLTYNCPGARPDFTVMNGNDLYIGKYSDSWYPFNGAMQDLNIYQKALTAQQVAALP